MADSTIQFPLALKGLSLTTSTVQTPSLSNSAANTGLPEIPSTPTLTFNPSWSPSQSTIQKPDGMGLLQTAATALPVAGSIANLLMSGYGMYLQHKAQKKQEELQEKAIDQQNYWIKVQNAIAERERGRQWAWLTDDKNYQRRIAAINAAMAQAANNKQLLNNLVSIWGGK